VAVQRDYSHTVRDLKALVLAETEGERKAQLTKNLELMNSEILRLRGTADVVIALKERVEGLTWMVRSVIVVAALEIVVGVTVALIMRGPR
jgi:hypothetical protein